VTKKVPINTYLKILILRHFPIVTCDVLSSCSL